MTVLYLLKLKETETRCWWMEEIDHDSGDSLDLLQWDQDCLSFADIQNLKTLTFVADIQIINAFDQDDNCMVYNEEEEKKEEAQMVAMSEPQYYEWKVSPASDIIPYLRQSTVIRSKIFTLFGIRWYLMIIPKPSRYSRYMRLLIGIADFPLDVTEISFYCKSGTKQLNDTKSYSLQLNDKKHYFPLNCDAENEGMDNIDAFTFTLEMILTGVYDKNGNDLSENYINDTEQEQKEVIINDNVNSTNDYKWNINNLEAEILESPFYSLPGEEIEFKIELNQKEDEISVILKPMTNLKQLSMECVLKIEAMNVIISGIVHFKKHKLKGSMINTMPRFATVTDLDEICVLINVNVITKHSD